MTVTQDAAGRRLVVSPQEGLVGGGPAEEFEARVQRLYRSGYHNLIVDLRHVPSIDSAGIRALVRGLTTAQRVGGSFGLVNLTRDVREILHISKLDEVFRIYESLEAAKKREIRWDRVGRVVFGFVLCTVLVLSGIEWQEAVGTPSVNQITDAEAASTPLPARQPFVELLKLVAAALVGLLVTAFHSPATHDRHLDQSMQQA